MTGSHFSVVSRAWCQGITDGARFQLGVSRRTKTWNQYTHFSACVRSRFSLITNSEKGISWNAYNHSPNFMIFHQAVQKLLVGTHRQTDRRDLIKQVFCFFRKRTSLRTLLLPIFIRLLYIFSMMLRFGESGRFVYLTYKFCPLHDCLILKIEKIDCFLRAVTPRGIFLY